MTNNEILNLKFYSGDLNKKISIRNYFQLLLQTLWLDNEEFNGKRPFGNSGWDVDIIKCLVENKLVKGSIDENGYLDDYNNEEVDKLIIKLIETMCKNQIIKG